MKFYDLLIVGGGATGSAIALYASSLGYKTIIIDKNDFANATSSISTKLIHGGVRYLQLALSKLQLSQFNLLYEALKERKIMINNCKNITNTLEILIPYNNAFQKYYYYIGLKLYDFLANINNGLLKKTHILPNYIAYYDGQFLDFKYVIYNLKKAEEFGAIIKNYNELIDVEIHTSGITALIKNNLTGKEYSINAKLLINATGPFADNIRLMINKNATKRILRSKGVHIVVPKSKLKQNKGILIPKTPDDRIAFILPWYYSTIIGTTDTPTNEFYPKVLKKDIDYLLDITNKYLPVEYKDITSYFVGVRPLILEEGKNSANIVRKHIIEVWKDKNTINVLGGKWTTHRKMAIDTLIEINKIIPKSTTSKIKKLNIKLCEEFYINNSNISEKLKEHLKIYGKNAEKIISSIKTPKYLHPDYPFTEAEIKYVIDNEYVKTLDDVLTRRIGLTLIDARASLQIAPRVVKLFNKPEEWRKNELEKFTKVWKEKFYLIKKFW